MDSITETSIPISVLRILIKDKFYLYIVCCNYNKYDHHVSIIKILFSRENSRQCKRLTKSCLFVTFMNENGKNCKIILFE